MTEETGIVDVESDEDPEADNAAAEDIVHEQMFVFEKYEAVSARFVTTLGLTG